MKRFRRLVHEIHRRSLWQVLSIYVVAAWVVYQVVLDLVQGLGLPDWVPPIALILFLIGLPIVLATAFIQEGISSQDPDRTEPEPGGSPRAVPGEPASAPAGRSLFTWRRVLLGGAGAFGLLAVVAVGWLGTRALGIGPAATLFAQGTLDERDRILLADFDSPPEDSLVAATVTEALRIDLEQSSVVRLLEPRTVEAALERMGREAGTRLDPQTSDELAIREGIPAVLVGEVHRAGDSFVLAARLVAPGGEGTLASFRESAGNAGEIIAAVDALSAKIRARIGESLRSVRASEPLERVTTRSLDALERYSRAVRLIAMEPESRQAITLLEEAVALDSTFAMAHLRLGMLYLFTGDWWSDRNRVAVAAAYRHRERLSVRERYQAEIAYHGVVTGDESAASVAIERYAAEHPDDPEALELLAYERMRQGEYGRMEEIGRRLMAIDSMRALSAEVLLQALGVAGRYNELEAPLDAYLRRFPADSLYILSLRGHVAAARLQWSDAEELWQRLRDSGRGTAWASRGTWNLAELALLEGRLRENLELALQAIRTSGVPDFMVRFQEAFMPLRQRAARGLPVAEQLASARSALRAAWLDSIPVLPPMQVDFARYVATGGEPELATQILETWETRASPDERRLARVDVLVTRIEIAIVQDRLDEALQHVRELRAMRAGRCPPCGLDLLGRVHDAAGRADSATTHYERFLQTDSWGRFEVDASARPLVLERLGSLYEAQGRLEDARAAYGEFISIWEGADPELQPRVEAARRRLASLVEARG